MRTLLETAFSLQMSLLPLVPFFQEPPPPIFQNLETTLIRVFAIGFLGITLLGLGWGVLTRRIEPGFALKTIGVVVLLVFLSIWFFRTMTSRSDLFARMGTFFDSMLTTVWQ